MMTAVECEVQGYSPIAAWFNMKEESMNAILSQLPKEDAI